MSCWRNTGRALGIAEGICENQLYVGNSGLKQNWITAIARVGDEWMIGTYGRWRMGLDSAGESPIREGQAPGRGDPNAMLVTKEHVFAGHAWTTGLCV